MNKRTWVLIRGLARESRHWMDFPKVLAEQFPHDKILTPDLPGFGQAFHRSSPRTVEGIARDLREQLGEEVLADGVYLLGLSLGGMVALEWMLEYPEEVHAGFILNSSAANLANPFQRLQPKAIKSFIKIGFHRSYEIREREILSVVCNRKEIQEEYLPEWIRIQKDKPSRFTPTLYQLLAAARFRPNLEELTNEKLLFLTSKGDRLCHPACSEKLSSATGSPVYIHPDAGHDLTADAPLWVIQRIKEWMK